MNAQIKNRLIRTGLLMLLGLGIGAAVAWMQVQGDMRKPAPLVAGVAIGGPFTLTDQNGKSVTEKDFAGRTRLIYFGFTYCPAICPTELAKMTRALKALGAQGETIAPLFVSVDPERDTPAVLKSYLSAFHPRFTGLTGTPAQVGAALKAYRVYAQKAQDPGMSEYTMDHSSFIYLIGPDDSLRAIYRTQDDADYMVRDIRAKI